MKNLKIARLKKNETTGISSQSSFGVERLLRRLLFDRLSKAFITIGAFVVIISVFAIVLVLAMEVVPLFKGASIHPGRSHTLSSEELSAKIVGYGVDEYSSNVHVFRENASVTTSRLTESDTLTGFETHQWSGAGFEASFKLLSKSLEGEYLAFAKDAISNVLLPISISYQTSFSPDGARTVEPNVSYGEMLSLPEMTEMPLLMASGVAGSGVQAVLAFKNSVIFVEQKLKKSLMGPAKSEISVSTPAVTFKGIPTSIELSARDRLIFIGTDSGELILRPAVDSMRMESFQVTNAKVSALKLLVGGRTLVAGFSDGGVRAWHVERSADGTDFRLRELAEFQAHQSEVISIEASSRTRSFVTLDTSGEFKIHYSTSGTTQLSEKPEPKVTSILFSPKADSLVTLNEKGRVRNWVLDNPHPEINLKTLFGKVLYEGRPEPEYVWQSSSGSDEFEPKVSLVPLILGTLKGTFYALLFAIPLAVLSAIYTSQFLSPRLRGYVKPTVELMAAIPSVVLGFLAGLWLAPRLEQVLLSMILVPAWMLIGIVVSRALCSFGPMKEFISKSRARELLALMVTIGISLYVCFATGPALELFLFGSSLQDYMRTEWSVIYDQRNTLVVAIAMGFAVIPIIFTISEDCLNSVPKGIVAGSLALGATRWQTALGVVLPSASPGIFSAIMIGLGRAVGETMIVLMATGNTPIMSWSVFNGFRALSANIAVELPEAPHGGSLFRVLFLTALLLFALTLVVNLISEIVRNRLRKKYAQG